MRSLETFGDRVIPVWSAHVGSSRQQLETAVGGIVSKFADMVSSLDAIVLSAREALDEEHGDVFNCSRTQLGEVVAALDTVIGQKQRTMQAFRPWRASTSRCWP